VPGLDQPGDDAADLDRRDLGPVVLRAQPHRVQRQRPRRPARPSPATTEYGQPGIICAWPLPRP
jgi:hypothetical protein